jgi:thiamine biosynthesis lipoprotein
MATRFEIVLPGDDAVRLRAAGEQAIEEIRLWHSRLSFFERASDISRINTGGGRPVRCDGELFTLIELCQRLWQQTGGAFDPTVAALMHAQGFRGGYSGAQAVRDAMSLTGFDKVELDSCLKEVRLPPGVQLDMGAIGKGWALDRAAAVLRECGVSRAFLHGGTSSVRAWAGEGPAWLVALGRDGTAGPSAVIVDGALGISAPSGRMVEGRGHVLNPSTGQSACEAEFAAIATESAAEANALSTAALVNPESAIRKFQWCDVVIRDVGGWRLRRGDATLTRLGVGWKLEKEEMQGG